MIEANFYIDSTGFVNKVTITGHAGVGEFGEDVVCASVSALIIATINGLEEYVGISTLADVVNGYTTFEIQPETEVQRIQADALANSFLLAMKGISEEFEDSVNIEITEV